MKAFHELECAELPQIQAEALAYIESAKPTYAGFWNKINTADFLKVNPTVFKYCLKLGYNINEVALLVASEQQAPPKIHVDEPPLIAKINFPILNASTTQTQWYDVPNIDELLTRKNQFGGIVPVFERNDYPIIASCDMKNPVVFNSSLPHAVIANENTVYPRIVLACMFNKQPVEFLEE